MNTAVLTNLNLGWNRIGAEGATAIAEALRGNGVLTTFKTQERVLLLPSMSRT